MSMSRVRIVNSTRGVCLATNAELASSFFAKFAGLMLRKDLPEGGGMVILSGEPIHMFFMRFALDVIHADKEGTVLRILPGIKPWRLGPFVRKCKMAIELPAGTAARTGTVEGDVIVLEDV
jgi:uncharacterized membrane protein (UPF0127 family)